MQTLPAGESLLGGPLHRFASLAEADTRHDATARQRGLRHPSAVALEIVSGTDSLIPTPGGGQGTRNS